MPNRYCNGLLISSLLCVLATYAVRAQSSVEYGYSRTIRIAAPAFKPVTDVEGTPYVPGDSVARGWIALGRKHIPVRLHYNAYTNEAEYMADNRILAAPSAVVEFAIVAPDTLHFKRGFPPVSRWSTNDFYQVLFDGRRTKLVKHVAATIKTNTDAMANEYGKKRFHTHEEYYIWVAAEKPPLENYAEKLDDGALKAVITNKKALLAALPQDAERIDTYVSQQHLPLKTWPDFIRVLRYLDTL